MSFSASLPATILLSPGEIVAGRYRVIEALGRGGQGSVVRAVDEELHREVALKVMGDDAAGRRARREGRALAAVRSPHVVGVFDVRDVEDSGSGDGPALLVLELVDGASLRDILDERSLSIDEVVAVGVGVLEGLTAAADAGVHHRDVKPDNIMVRGARPSFHEAITSAAICLVDFGLAVGHGGPPGDSVVFAGSPAWLAPERANVAAGDIDEAAADAYSLGVVLLEALLGANPFAAPTVAQTLLRHERDPPPPATLGRAPGEVDDDLARIVASLLEKTPARRLGTRDALAALRARMSVKSPRTPTTTTASPRRRAASIAAVVVAALAGLGVVVATARPSPVATPMAVAATPPSPVGTSLPPTTTATPTTPTMATTTATPTNAPPTTTTTATVPRTAATATTNATTTTAPWSAPSKPDLPVPWPAGLAARRRLLAEQCRDLPCATLASAPVPEDLTALSVHKADVDACLTRCAER